MESVSDPRGHESGSADVGEPTVPERAGWPDPHADDRAVLPSTCTSLVHGDTATTRPARPSALAVGDRAFQTDERIPPTF